MRCDGSSSNKTFTIWHMYSYKSSHSDFWKETPAKLRNPPMYHPNPNDPVMLTFVQPVQSGAAGERIQLPRKVHWLWSCQISLTKAAAVSGSARQRNVGRFICMNQTRLVFDKQPAVRCDAPAAAAERVDRIFFRGESFYICLKKVQKPRDTMWSSAFSVLMTKVNI